MKRAVVGIVLGTVAAGLAVRARRQHTAVQRIPAEVRFRSLYVPLTYRGPLLPMLRRALAVATPVADGVEHTEHVTVPGRDGHVPTAHVYRPQGWQGGPALLWMHGGGYIGGSAVRENTTCSELARDLGILVVSVDYRLAPDFPFPAALDDAHAVAEWLVTSAGLGVDPDRIAIAGASAGGGLAAGLVQRLVDTGPIRPAFQLLVYPMIDDRTSNRAWCRAPALVWTRGSNRFAWRSYLGAAHGAGEPAPYAVPARRVDLSGLPPTWIGVGDVDLFHDEDVAYARRLEDAGVSVTLDVVPGMYHAADTAWADRAAVTAGFRARLRDAVRDGLGLSAMP